MVDRDRELGELGEGDGVGLEVTKVKVRGAGSSGGLTNDILSPCLRADGVLVRS